MDEAGKLSMIIRGLSKFGEVSLKVTGESMAPILPPGTEIKIVKKTWREIKPFDWAAVRRGGQLMIHEVLFKGKDYLVTWGVNNGWTDGKIGKERVLGIVEKRESWRRWHLIFLSEAKSILGEFEEVGIKSLILKGPPWQIAKYGFLLDKPSADVDWLVDREKFLLVKDILMKKGYRLKRLNWVKRSEYSGRVPRASEMTFTKKIPGGVLAIDLHLFAIREARRAWYKEPITEGNMNALNKYFLVRRRWSRGWPVLSDTDSLFYLCLNLMFHHGGRGFYQLANVAHLAARNRVDWRAMVKAARDYRTENYLYFPLLWAQRLFKVKVPILAAVDPGRLRRFLAKVLINRWTVARPLPAGEWFHSRLNLWSILFLRLVLSVFKNQKGKLENKNLSAPSKRFED